MQRRILPPVPQGLDLNLLADNLRLFSRRDIEIMLASGIPYERAIFVDGRLFGVYAGDYARLSNELNNNEKLVQDLKTGEWLILRTMPKPVSTQIDDLVEDEPLLERHVLLSWSYGLPLQKWMDPAFPISLINKLELAIAIVRAVKAVHDEGIVHGDLCAANFKISRHGEGYVATLLNSAKSYEREYEYELFAEVEKLGILITSLWRNDPKLVRVSLPMMHADQEERPALKDVLDSLKRMRDKLVAVERNQKVASLRVDQFLHLQHEGGARYRSLLCFLKTFDEIRLIDNALHVSDKDLVAIRATLESEQILVINDVWVGPQAEYLAEALIPEAESYNIAGCMLDFFCDLMQDLRNCCTNNIEMEQQSRPQMMLFAPAPADVVIDMESDNDIDRAVSYGYTSSL